MAEVLRELVSMLAARSVRVIDLTQTLSPDTPVIALPPEFAASPGFSMTEISRFDERGPLWRWNSFAVGEHTGTHFDAPDHWISGRDLPANTTDTLDPARLIGPACVIDASREVEQDEDFLLTPGFVESWERLHGAIPPGSWLLLRTGWSLRTDPAVFLNMREDGAHTPGFAPDAVRLLIERDVLGVGVETVGTDAGLAHSFDPPFPAHHLMLGAGKFGLASLRQLDALPATGALVIAAPLKLKDGSGSPCRVLALAPQSPR